MPALRPSAMTALAFLFLAEAQRALFGSAFALASRALHPAFDPGAAALAVLPFAAVLVPMLPLARWVDRQGVVALSVAGMALFRLPMSYPALPVRAVTAALVLAFGALFLAAAVGHVERRALAVGAVLGLVLDQLLRLAGLSYDLSLQPAWIPVQAVLTLVAVWTTVAWARRPAPDRGDGLERRAGGLRLRGGLAIGAVFFADLHVLGLPPVVSRWSGLGYDGAALAVSVGSALALAVAMGSRRPGRDRVTVLALVATVTAALMVGLWGRGPAVGLLMAAGHAAALVLLTRALEPASGRREGRVVSAGFALFVALTGAYTLTYFPGFTVELVAGARPWILAVPGLVLAAALLLLPRPPVHESRPPLPWALGSAAAVVGVALLLLRVILPAEPAPASTAPISGGAAPTPAFRVASLNVHQGYDEAWRFDPAAIAAVLADRDPDLAALQEVSAGLPSAYGVDLPLWLGRRLGTPAFFAPAGGPLLGTALLSRLPTRQVNAVALPSGARPGQLVRLHAVLGGRSVVFYGAHLDVDPEARGRQIDALVDRVGSTLGVVLGDLNEEGTERLVSALEAAGFEDAFALAHATPDPTFPASDPRRRIDWIWVRGLEVVGAGVAPAAASDHRLVWATLQLRREGLR